MSSMAHKTFPVPSQKRQRGGLSMAAFSLLPLVITFTIEKHLNGLKKQGRETRAVVICLCCALVMKLLLIELGT